jgi:putative glycosyltransferase (TIGR04372 family)
MSADRIIETTRKHPLMQPFRIMALLMDRALGDFALHLLGAISVKDQFDDATLAVYCHDDRPYKKALLACAPQIDTLIQYPERKSMPVDYFDAASGNPIFNKDPRWNEKGLAVPSMVLTQSMLTTETMARLPRVDHLRFPEDRKPEFADRLKVLGIDADRPHCCIHFREPNYELRTANEWRDSTDTTPYETLRDHLIDELGFQVVRIGHPTHTEFHPREGYVDLKDEPDDFFQHAFAISQARFNVMGPSGPGSVSMAFGVPSGLSDSSEFQGGVNFGDAVLHRTLWDASGRKVPISERLEKGWIGQGAIRDLVARGHIVRPNTADELCRLANHMASVTDTGKSGYSVSYNAVRPNEISWPPKNTELRGRYIEFFD